MAPPFTLAAVLAMRERKEQAEEQALGAISGELGRATQILQRLDAELAGTAERRAAEVQAVFDGAHHHTTYARYRLMTEARTHLLGEIEALEGRQREQQAAYVAARAARETLTDLRAKQRTAWQVEVERREQKRIEDLFNARHINSGT